MGLDVSVFKNVKRTDIENEVCFTAIVIDERWEYKIKNLENEKDYKGDYAISKVSYGYSTHNRFREILLKIIGRNDLLVEGGEINWERIKEQNKLPFYELIWFADNEGCLDFEISNILYQNFLYWKEDAMKYFNENRDDYFKEKYLDWLNVFESGKEVNSVVVFH